ncbi:MAG: urease accessory protein UreD [Beijerinckiaceae bacterium]
MTAHPFIPARIGGRDGRLYLSFHTVGTRTRIGRQYVSYPFHLTRPFALDANIPALATVYQQSASGGLYRDDKLSSRLELSPGTAVHLTTQAATIVHDCRGHPARQSLDAIVGENAFLALTPDPLVFFPGASLASQTTLRLGCGAAVLQSDAFACHDPSAASRVFDRYASDLVVLAGPTGRTLLRDRFTISGIDLINRGSPVGTWRIAASHLLLGRADRLPTREALLAATQASETVAGVSLLPNGAGWGVRVLSNSAVAERIVAEALFSVAVASALGARPARRRK